jgi:hypothetical protein
MADEMQANQQEPSQPSAPLFDMAKAQTLEQTANPAPAPNNPLFDMSKAQPLTSGEQPGAMSRFVSGAVGEVGDAITSAGSAIKSTVGAAVAPPQDPQETLVYAHGGQTGLAAYRAANKVVESAQNLAKAKKETFHQAATDFVRTAQDLHSGQWRQGVSDAGSTVGDLMLSAPVQKSP